MQRINPGTAGLFLLAIICTGVSPTAFAGQAVGEACDAISPCGDGAFCLPMPWLGLGEQRCVPESVELNDAVCYALYDVAVFADSIDQLTQPGALGDVVSYSGGVSAAVGVTGSLELGAAYSVDGQFGCFTSVCAGLGVALGVDIFGAQAFWGEWDDVAGTSVMDWVGGGVGLSYMLTAFFALDDPVPIGGGHVGSLGISLDVAAGASLCSTEMITLITPESLYVDVGATLDGNGSSFAPFETFGLAYGNSRDLDAEGEDDGVQPTITLRASNGATIPIAPGTYTKSVVLTADEGAVVLVAEEAE